VCVCGSSAHTWLQRMAPFPLLISHERGLSPTSFARSGNGPEMEIWNNSITRRAGQCSSACLPNEDVYLHTKIHRGPNEDVYLEDTPEKMYNVVSLKRIVKCIFGYHSNFGQGSRGWPKSGGVPVLVADPRFAWSSRKGSFAIMQCAVSSAHRALRLVPI